MVVNIGLTLAQIEHIQNKFSIPVNGFSSGSDWIISIDRESLMPTNAELARLVSYTEYITKKIYSHNYGQKIIGLEFPHNPGHNTTIFKKGSSSFGTEGHWYYRKETWMGGPMYLPDVSAEDYTNFTLIELLGKIESTSTGRWTRWKTTHSDIFPS